MTFSYFYFEQNAEKLIEGNKIKAKPAYIQYDVPSTLIIKGYDLYFKAPPLKNEEFKYRCRKTDGRYFIKINSENIEKFKKMKKILNILIVIHILIILQK